MTVVAIVPLVVAIVGLLVYFMASNPKAVDVGRILFAAGVLATLLAVAGRSVHL